jgi:hypothetical protein
MDSACGEPPGRRRLLLLAIEWPSALFSSLSGLRLLIAAAVDRRERKLNIQAGFYLYHPVHPGTAKQVMEPAILWFERRVRRVQTCDKRQTLGVSAKSQRAAIIQRFFSASSTHIEGALSGQAVPQGAFAVSGER